MLRLKFLFLQLQLRVEPRRMNARRIESGVRARDRGRDEKGHNGRAEVEGKQEEGNLPRYLRRERGTASERNKWLECLRRAERDAARRVIFLLFRRRGGRRDRGEG